GGRVKQAPQVVAEEVVDVAETVVVAEVEADAVKAVEAVDAVEEVEAAEVASTPAEEPFEIEYWPLTQEWTPPPPKEETETVEEEVVVAEEESAGDSSWTVIEEEPQPLEEPVEETLPDGLIINLLDDEEFYSGKAYTLRVLITKRSAGEENPMASAAVSIKILGTTFRP